VRKGLLVTIAMLALASAVTPTLACSVGRMSPAEIRAEQARDLREADLIFLAQVIGHAAPDEPDLNVVLYQPLEPISGELPASLAVAVFYCLPLPAIGEAQVVLMRSTDLSVTPDRTSPVQGNYNVSDVHHPGLSRRVDRALRRANIE
jgi:hypothetical protein